MLQFSNHLSIEAVGPSINLRFDGSVPMVKRPQLLSAYIFVIYFLSVSQMSTNLYRVDINICQKVSKGELYTRSTRDLIQF